MTSFNIARRLISTLFLTEAVSLSTLVDFLRSFLSLLPLLCTLLTRLVPLVFRALSTFAIADTELKVYNCFIFSYDSEIAILYFSGLLTGRVIGFWYTGTGFSNLGSGSFFATNGSGAFLEA